ncbi:MAG TPA: hypothetical protein DEP48_01740 [Persephonella sp.]|uniref:Uncharacterized protein n=1 Tax=Persephonella marina (strain DSM 14350 / EX-H1) TaxID=123214 RepID=C0QRL7_PERMH|nr:MULTISPECIES: hypothetical protein [Persephonella]ACO04595.1 hypothetical protein PERMA_1546 [Persephonella marina EX-H1]HCB69059.1 hypothetical protein [Persephonella sp.]
MRKLIPKEELDALFKEIYNTETTEIDYTTDRKELKLLDARYRFLMYRYKTALKKIFVSNIPIKVSIKETSVTKNREVEDKNNFLYSYDVEGKFRFFIGISESIATVERKIYEENIYSLFKNENNLHSIMENISLSIVKTVQNDFPFKFKKINSSAVQFYNDDFITFDYNLELEGDSITVSLFFEELMLEAVETDVFIFSPPTSYGRKLLEKLKRKIILKLSVDSEPVDIDLSKLRKGSVIDLDKIKFMNSVKGEER